MIHVSDILHYNQCSRLAYNYHTNKKKMENFYHMNVPFHELYCRLLNIKEYGMGNTGDDNEKSCSLIEKNEFILNARFEYKGCRTRIPLIQKTEKGLIFYYPFLSAYPKEFEAQKMKINQMICEKIGFTILDTKIIYLNKDYIRKDSLDVNQCLICGDCFFNRRNNAGKKVKEVIDSIEIDLDQCIEQVSELFSKEIPEAIRTKKCTAGRRCRFYDFCFDESNEPDDSILFFTTSSHKLDLYEEGIHRIKDMRIDKIEGFRLQYAQYMASLYGTFMDVAALVPWISQIQYPVSYLDFEWDTFAIPPYKNMKPFDVLCFQYSLHVEQKNGDLNHFDFFGSGDCRKQFIESLIASIPKEGTILVYNMEGAEKLRLMQLANQFPEYKEELESIWTRMLDLAKPFELGVFYDNKMRGHYSLKKLLPVFTEDVSYHELDIQNGMNAVFAYRTFDRATPKQKEEIAKQIREYCSMDTYSEYIIYHGLLKELKKRGVSLTCQI
ncbi:DUF2779 domain-containing protein [Floccifex sp.]|uniref:DUF2779 domain-containing protein n=1 Tax=Floccifex sp. TaxID=2815810 RepID=UPI003F04B4F2